MDKNNLLKTSCALSSLWDGKPASRVRGGDDIIIVYGKRVSLHLMIQEIVLTSRAPSLVILKLRETKRKLLVFFA